jgi:hypothetical protein
MSVNRKTITSIIVAVLIIIGAIALYIHLYGKDKNSMVGAGTVHNLCFAQIFNDPDGTSTISILASLYPNHNVGGRLDVLPGQKDSAVGTFTGTWNANGSSTVLDITHSYVAEGASSTAERSIIISGTYAQIDWDGPGSATTSNDKIPKVACQ